MKSLLFLVALVLPVMTFAQTPCDSSVNLQITAVGVNPNCPGETGSITVSASGGSGIYRYYIDWFQFSGGSGGISGPATKDHLEPGTYEMRVIDHTLECWSSSVLVTLANNSNFDVEIVDDGSGTVCTEITDSSLVQNSFSYSWNSNEDTPCITSYGEPWVYSVTVADTLGCEQSAELIVYSPTAVSETLAKQVSIYPNPVHDVLYIENLEEGNQIFLYNTFGQFVVHKTVKHDIETFDLSYLAPGLYSLVLQNGNTVSTLKVLKE